MKYIYRGMVIVEYDPETKQLTFPDDPEGGGAAIQHVRLLPEDAWRLGGFFTNAFYDMHGGLPGYIAILEDVVVN